MMRYSSSSSSQVAPQSLITEVDCQNQVRSWRLLRSLIEFLIPTCNCSFAEEHEEADSNMKYIYQAPPRRRANETMKNVVTGTMFGYRGERIYFCIQTDHNASSPSILLELVVPNKTLAREMQGGVLHIELQNKTLGRQNCMVYWTMYCNGKKVGFAVRRRASVEELGMMRFMGSVETGAGIVNKGRKELLYLRARFERAGFGGAFNVESFHLIDPEGCIGQELSITFHG